MLRVDGIDPATPELVAKCAIDEAIATCILQSFENYIDEIP